MSTNAKFDRLIKEKGMTYKELAKKSGVSASTIHRVRYRKYTPDTKTLKKLAKFFNVDPMELT